MSSSGARTSSTATRCRTTWSQPDSAAMRVSGARRAARVGSRDRTGAGGADGNRLRRPAGADPRAARPRPAVAAGGDELTAARPRLACLSTGSAALDRILGGGLPVRSVNVIAGEPGAGKTILALQMLFHQARQGKKGLYLTTLSEPSLKLVSYMQQFSFFDERLIADKRVVIADLGSVMRRKGVDETLAEIVGRVEQEEPALVVIDSFKALRDVLGDAAALRTFVYDLAVHVASWGAASLFVGEYTPEEIATLVGVRHRRRHHPARQPPRRAAGDPRGRGAQAARGQRRHRRSLLRDRRRRARVLPARARPGRRVRRAGGGSTRAPRPASPGSTTCSAAACRGRARTVVQGGTGTGKTLLGLQFLLEGARRGESRASTSRSRRRRTSSAASPRASAGTCAAFEERGLLDLPLRLARRALDRPLPRSRRGRRWSGSGARRAVLDSLTSMALGVPSERRFKELVYAIDQALPRRGRDAQHEHGGRRPARAPAQLSGHGVSFAADNVIQLKYVEVDGRLERGISVLKARGVRHATDVRRLSVGARPDRGRVGVRGPARSADRPARPRGHSTVDADSDRTDALRHGAAPRVGRRRRRARAARARAAPRLVPYEQCALLEAQLGHEPHVVLVPEPAPEERVVLTETLRRHLRAARRPATRDRGRAAARPEEAHLAVPLVGLDEVIGIFLCASSVTDVHARSTCARSRWSRRSSPPTSRCGARRPRSASSPASATRRGAPSRRPGARKTSSWRWSRPSSTPARVDRRRAATSCKHKSGAGPAPRRLLGQARTASAELRQNLSGRSHRLLPTKIRRHLAAGRVAGGSGADSRLYRKRSGSSGAFGSDGVVTKSVTPSRRQHLLVDAEAAGSSRRGEQDRVRGVGHDLGLAAAADRRRRHRAGSGPRPSRSSSAATSRSRRCPRDAAPPPAPARTGSFRYFESVYAR